MVSYGIISPNASWKKKKPEGKAGDRKGIELLSSSSHFTIEVIFVFLAKAVTPELHNYSFGKLPSQFVEVYRVALPNPHTMPIQTRVTELLGIQYPIIMGGMTGVGTPELVSDLRAIVRLWLL